MDQVSFYLGCSYLLSNVINGLFPNPLLPGKGFFQILLFFYFKFADQLLMTGFS
jgi:hypothetical protein